MKLLVLALAAAVGAEPLFRGPVSRARNAASSSAAGRFCCTPSATPSLACAAAPTGGACSIGSPMSKACCDATCGTTTAPPPGPFSYEVVLAACNASDDRQKWTFGARGEVADVKNAGTCTCLEGIDTSPAKTSTCLPNPGSGAFTWGADGSLTVAGGVHR